MKAYVHVKYGSGKYLRLDDLNKPNPKEEEVQIEIKAVSINPLDWRMMLANPGFIRISRGLFRPKKTILGADIAGVISAVGSNVEDFSVGDQVLAELDQGGFAEFVCGHQSKIAKIPENVSFQQAAALPVAGLTALQALRDHGQLQSGESLLINGASGGIGTIAIQLAKYYGATVDAICSSRNIELVSGLGANSVYDYTRQDITKQGKQYDVILDAVGNMSVKDYIACLKEKGRSIVAGFTSLGRLFSVISSGKRILRNTGKTVKTFTAQARKEDLATLLQLVADGHIEPVIEKTYSFTQIPEALDYGTTKRTRGKLVVVY